jgi:hypothetical protein
MSVHAGITADKWLQVLDPYFQLLSTGVDRTVFERVYDRIFQVPPLPASFIIVFNDRIFQVPPLLASFILLSFMTTASSMCLPLFASFFFSFDARIFQVRALCCVFPCVHARQ